MLGTVTVDIVMGPDGLLQFVADDQTGALCARSAGEHHNSCTRVGVSSLAGRRLVTQERQLW